MSPVLLGVHRLHAAAVLPTRATSQSAGLDLYSTETVVLGPGERARVSTGIAIEIPRGFEGQIRPRLGLAIRHGITVLNAPGTIDSDYRGEIGVLLINLGQDRGPIILRAGERIAQLIIAPVSLCEVCERSTSLSPTERGAGGFESTGI